MLSSGQECDYHRLPGRPGGQPVIPGITFRDSEAQIYLRKKMHEWIRAYRLGSYWSVNL